MKVQLLVPAAGMGARLGADGPKALIDLCECPMLVRTLKRFAPLGLVENAIVVTAPGHQPAFRDSVARVFPSSGCRFVEGGAERQDSVGAGLAALDADTDIVVIHDAARPFVAADSIRQSIEAAAECGAATVAVPCVDTILMADAKNYLEDTPDRRVLWACQTPQTFRVDVIRAAHERARDESFGATDDATLVRRFGGKVRLVMGTPLNFKVTTPADLALAVCILEKDLT